MTEPLELPVNPERGEGELLVTPAWNGLKQQILHLAQFGGSVQVVCGAKGAGKSAFLSLLSQEAKGLNFVALYHSASSDLGSLLFGLLNELGLRAEEGAAAGQLIAALRGYVQSLEAEASRAVVAIDNAHNMADANLAALLSVLKGGQDSGFGLHLILLGESGLAERIDQIQLLDVSVHDVLLPGFSPGELKALFEERVHSGRLRSDLPVDRVQKVWVQSGGLPGPALALFDTMAAEESGSNRGGLTTVHFVALAVLVVLLLWAVFGQESEPPNEKVDNDNPLPTSGMVQRNGPSDLAAPTVDHQQGVDALYNQASIVRSGQPQISSSKGGALPVNPSPVAIGLDEKRSGDHSGTSTSKVLAVAPNDGSPLAVISDNLSNQAELKEGTRSIQSLESQEALSHERAASAEVVEPEVKPKPSSKEASGRTKGVLKSLQETEAELLGLPPNQYVLQLMATSEREALYQYIERQPNSGNLKVYRGLRGGNSFYILVEGFYADRQAALSAIVNLPARQRKASPWPKKLVDIHREIEEFGRK